MKTGAPASLPRVQGSSSFPAAVTGLLHFKEHVACGGYSDVLFYMLPQFAKQRRDQGSSSWPVRALSAESDWTSNQLSQGLEYRERLDDLYGQV